MSQPNVLHEVRGADYAVRVVRYAPLTQMARHAHDYHGLSAVLEGDVIEEVDHRTIVARAGWVVNKPRGMFHANRFGPCGATLVALSFADPDAVPLSRWCWRLDPVALRDALRLLAHGADRDTVTHILERTTSPGLAVADRRWIRKIQERIDGDPSMPVATLASDAGVHPVALARAFRRQHGVSVREYKRQIQLRRAVHLLSATRLSVAQVALECGFTNHSHMCRAFARDVGWSPGRLRRKN